jgi:hypothetical protein
MERDNSVHDDRSWKFQVALLCMDALGEMNGRWLLPSGPCGSELSIFVAMNTYAWRRPLATF